MVFLLTCCHLSHVLLFSIQCLEGGEDNLKILLLNILVVWDVWSSLVTLFFHKKNHKTAKHD